MLLSGKAMTQRGCLCRHVGVLAFACSFMRSNCAPVAQLMTMPRKACRSGDCLSPRLRTILQASGQSACRNAPHKSVHNLLQSHVQDSADWPATGTAQCLQTRRLARLPPATANTKLIEHLAACRKAEHAGCRLYDPTLA